MAEHAAPLADMRWQPLTEVALPSAYHSWLAEQGSMTCRLEQYCTRLQVAVQREGLVSGDMLQADERAQLPFSARYWLREVVLYGDGVPWLFGRTLALSDALDGESQALCRLGATPLGRYLFSGVSLARESLLVGCQGALWGRRSRLRVEGRPLLLSELFLAEAPMYGG